MSEEFTMQVPSNPFHSPMGQHTPMANHQGLISSTSTSDVNGHHQGIFNVTKRRRVEEESMEGSPLRQCQCGNSAEFTAYRGKSGMGREGFCFLDPTADTNCHGWYDLIIKLSFLYFELRVCMLIVEPNGREGFCFRDPTADTNCHGWYNLIIKLSFLHF